jgi:hypothetical protein
LAPLSAPTPGLSPPEDLAPVLHARPAGLFERIADIAEPLLRRDQSPDAAAR